MENRQPEFLGLYLFVASMPETLRFYELLGLNIQAVSGMFARATWANGMTLEFGTSELTRSYDPDWKPGNLSSTNTINFQLASRAAVDETYEKMTGAGYVGHLAPCDPLWQARFAILLDPDRNFIGLHSPRNRESERQRESTQA